MIGSMMAPVFIGQFRSCCLAEALRCSSETRNFENLTALSLFGAFTAAMAAPETFT